MSTHSEGLRLSIRPLWGIVASSLLLASVGVAQAADAPAQPAAPSKEMREKMAAMHEQMASCLRSDKPIADCRNEMMQGCQSMGGQACSMMGMGGMGHMGSGMHGQSPSKPASGSAPK